MGKEKCPINLAANAGAKWKAEMFDWRVEGRSTVV
jgi:hypothetical protein